MPKRQRTRDTTAPIRYMQTRSLIASFYKTMSSSNLGTLPAELLDRIADFLDARNVSNFRLTCRSVVFKVSSGAAGTYFRRKTILLTVESLTLLNEMLQPSIIVRRLEDITLMSTVSTGPPEQDLVNGLLTKAFTTLKQHRGQLRSLNFKIVYDHDHETKGCLNDLESRYSALQQSLFKASTTALKESRLCVRILDWFGNDQRISIDVIRESLDLERLNPLLERVSSFSLSLTSEPTQSEDSEDTRRRDTISAENIAVVGRLLGQMHSLEALYLLWYKSRPVRDTPEAFFFDSCSNSITSSALNSCTLRDIYISEESLRGFLQNTPAKRIILREVHLRNGSFTSILDILTRRQESFDYFHLDDLFEENLSRECIVYFKVPGTPKFPTLHGRVGPSEVLRQGEEVKQKLEYTFARGRPLGSCQAQRWRLQRGQLYGNPRGVV